MNKDKRAIGFIDSGVGGLTVVREAMKQLPNETIYYLGDSARCPYGPRPKEDVIAFTLEMVHFLLKKDIKLLVIACNTATAAVLPALREQLTIPVIGVIEPGVRAALKHTHNERVAVIGTQGTIDAHVYDQTLQAKKPTVTVLNQACPPFVHLVEQNQANSALAKKVVAETLDYLSKQGVDTLILGCTHYPLLKPIIQNVMGNHVKLIDSGAETITDVSMLLDYFSIANLTGEKLAHQFFTTGDTHVFDRLANQWISEPVTSQQVTIAKGAEDMTEKILLVATKNAGKAKEFERIFGEAGYKVKTLLDYPEIADVEETGTTFEENARLKAETIAKQLGVLTLADDSGLMVDALDGQPGVFSARYAGEPKSDAANNAKLLAMLAEYPDASRAATFHCTLVLAHPNKESLVVEGQLHGEIADVPKGDNGFGYDPLFYLADYGKTTAELSAEEKNKISHRRMAINALLEKWQEWIQA